MIVSINWRELPAWAANRLFLDYIEGGAASFYSYPLLGFREALEGRRNHPYPRQRIVQRIGAYNALLGAHPAVETNIAALRRPSTFCVITGQQAGFMGGPVYTAYKIISTIRLAAHLSSTLGTRVVPVFWLATEDHDFGEINHVHYLKDDGEVGRTRFAWAQEGHSVIELPVNDGVRRAYSDYLKRLPGPHVSRIEELFSPRIGDDYCTWHARIWSRLFGGRGLVIVEPTILREAARDFFQTCLRQSHRIRHLLQDVAKRLGACGYAPSLSADTAGQLYVIDDSGRRVRVTQPQEHLGGALENPERYSTDAALRPLFADVVLPVLASVVGPGEIAYQAMLRPLYELFGVPQPVMFPRKSYTIVAQNDLARLEGYGMTAKTVLTTELSPGNVLNNLMPDSTKELFASARAGVEAALAPLKTHLESIDPSLGNTWIRAVTNITKSIDGLEDRGATALMGKSGLSKGEVQMLRNALLPRGRLQERIFPLPHFLSRHGPGFLEAIFGAGDLDDFSHHVLSTEVLHG